MSPPGTGAAVAALGVVSGASRGIGAAIARRLAAGGMRVAGLARNGAALARVAADLGGSATFEGHAVDLTDAAAVAAFAAELERRGEHPRLLVNNAGAAHVAAIADTTPDEWRHVIDSNLTSAFLLTHALLPGMLARGEGHIVNVLSVAARGAFPGWGAYTAAKAGLRGMTDVLREEVRAHGVRVTAVYAGATDTALWDTLAGTWNRDRMMPAEAIAEAVWGAWTASPAALVEEIVLAPARGAL